jgi:hypothetical protein
VRKLIIYTLLLGVSGIALGGYLASGPDASDTTIHLYVASNGADTNPGTRSAPLRTISKAGALAKPGYMVHVAEGSYHETITTVASGTAEAYITYVSDKKWGAKIDSPATGRVASWHNKGDYVAIVGFEITGRGAMGINLSGSGNIASKNHVHRIPATACDGYGGAGIGFDQYNVKSGGSADSNEIHDIGPLGTNCFRVHGIYTSIPHVTISNNVIYRVVGYGATSGHCAYNIKVLNNTMFNNGGTVEGGGVVMTRNTNCALPAKDNVVSNNLIYDNMLGVHEEGLGRSDVTLYTNNSVFGNKTDWGTMRNAHSRDVNAAPVFVNYRRDGEGDYRLRTGSPQIGGGSRAHFAPNDFHGNARPGGTGVDIGAFQH